MVEHERIEGADMTDPTERRFFGYRRDDGSIVAMPVWEPNNTPEKYRALDRIVEVTDVYQATDLWHAEREAIRRLTTNGRTE